MTDAERPTLTKGTYNHPPAAVNALTGLAASWQMTRTDALNRALLVAAVVDRIAPDRHLVVQRSDGSTVEVWLV